MSTIFEYIDNMSQTDFLLYVVIVVVSFLFFSRKT